MSPKLHPHGKVFRQVFTITTTTVTAGITPITTAVTITTETTTTTTETRTRPRQGRRYHAIRPRYEKGMKRRSEGVVQGFLDRRQSPRSGLPTKRERGDTPLHRVHQHVFQLHNT